MKKRMGCKACDEPKPQQPVGCEDLGEEYNEADRLFCAPLFVAVATALAVAPTAAFAAISAAA